MTHTPCSPPPPPLFSHHDQAKHPVRVAFKDNHDPNALRHPRRVHPRTALFRRFSLLLLIPSRRFPQISLHSILSFSNESYGQKTSVSHLFGGKNGGKEPNAVDVIDLPPFSPQLGKANAVLLVLCRNEDVDGAVKSIRGLEDRFNNKYHYPWVFLNEVEFTEDFKTYAFPVTFC